MREAILEIPFHVIFGERGRLGVTRNSTRSNAYANRQTCFGQKRLLAWVATMSRCHQRNICARHNGIISIRNSRASRHKSIESRDDWRKMSVPRKINFRFCNIKFLL